MHGFPSGIDSIGRKQREHRALDSTAGGGQYLKGSAHDSQILHAADRRPIALAYFRRPPGDGFGFIGNTFPASDSTRENLPWHHKREFPSIVCAKTAADRLNENVDRFIANMPMLKSKSSHISQDISLSQDGTPCTTDSNRT